MCEHLALHHQLPTLDRIGATCCIRSERHLLTKTLAWLQCLVTHLHLDPYLRQGWRSHRLLDLQLDPGIQWTRRWSSSRYDLRYGGGLPTPVHGSRHVWKWIIWNRFQYPSRHRNLNWPAADGEDSAYKATLTLFIIAFGIEALCALAQLSMTKNPYANHFLKKIQSKPSAI